MGSFAVQQYLLDHSADIDAVILTGTALLDLREPPRDDGQPRTLARPDDASTPARTGYDWLSRDEAVVDAYIADPMCGFSIDGAARQQMYAGGLRFADPDALGQLRPGLPVYIAVGDKDPVNACAHPGEAASGAARRGRADRRDPGRLPRRPARGAQRD